MEVVFTIMLYLHLDETEHNDIATPDLSGQARKVMQGHTLQLCCDKQNVPQPQYVAEIKPQFIYVEQYGFC